MTQSAIYCDEHRWRADEGRRKQKKESAKCRDTKLCDKGDGESILLAKHRHKPTRTKDMGKLVQEQRSSVLSGCVWCLMRQRDVKTDSSNGIVDGHTVEQNTRTHTHARTHARTHTHTHTHTLLSFWALIQSPNPNCNHSNSPLDHLMRIFVLNMYTRTHKYTETMSVDKCHRY